MTKSFPAWLRVTASGITVAVAAQPNARRSEIVGCHGDALKIKVASPPVEGAANEALVRFLADKLGIKQRDVLLLRGPSSRQKVFEIRGVTPETAEACLAPPEGE